MPAWRGRGGSRSAASRGGGRAGLDSELDLGGKVMRQGALLLRVVSADKSFIEFCDALAHDLGDKGVVYLPHPHIPPNARVAIPIPTEAAVYLKSPVTFSLLYFTIQQYMQRSAGRSLHLEGAAGAVDLSAVPLPEEGQLRKQLLGPA